MIDQSKNSFNQWVDIDKLETVICLEAVLVAGYQSLAGFIHNETIRKECKQLERRAQYHQEELRRIFSLSQESEIAIENKLYKYLSQLQPPYLFLRAVINLVINLTANKIDIYQYLSSRNQEHKRILNQFIDDSKAEMNFLCRERNFHQNSLVNAA